VSETILVIAVAPVIPVAEDDATPDTSAAVSVTVPVRPATLLTIAVDATSSHAYPVHE
jgi:hypothetical protein